MTRLARPLAHARDRYDAIVIGSGYGGGVAAARLARAGRSVCVLERGREFPTGAFPQKFSDLRAEMQVRGGPVDIGPDTGLYDVRIGRDMHVLVGCGLGGGSLINAGVALEPEARVFADPVWPGPLRTDGLLAEGYRRARRWLRPMPDPAAGERTKYRALASSSQALGRAPVAPPVCVSFASTRNPAGVDQPACTGCGDCCAGCNVGAKNTVAVTYLPDAARHGAQLFVEAKVTRLERRPEGWRVTVTDHSARARSARTIGAGLVVLAAGTLGSTEILLRSQAAGLAISDRVGERFSANGDIIAFGYGAKLPVNAIGIGHPPKLDGAGVGAAVSGQVEIADAAELSRSMIIQEGAVPSALAPALPVMFVPNGRLLGALQSLIAGVYKGPLGSLQTYFAVSHDSAAGRLRLDRDRLVLEWPGAADEQVHARLDAALEKLVAAGGGSYVRNPLAGTVMGHQPATAHPLGGAPMSSERATGVVDHRGRVFDAAAADPAAVHPGLLLVDGAAIPRSLGCNPLLTITALAERAMILHGRDHGPDLPDV